MLNAEKRYIFKRKIKAFVNSLCFYLCRVWPVEKELISVCTFEGKGGFGCNPKYIVQELHVRNINYAFIWFVNDMDKEFPDYIKKVPNTLWNRAYWLSRSKIWIDNYRKPYGTVKRKGQYYINTWHGTIGFKTTGLWRGTAFSKMAYLVSKSDSDMVDRFVIDSEWCNEMFPKGLVYKGEFLKSGAPRMDILMKNKDAMHSLLRNKHGIEQDSKIVMFAPTFREKNLNGVRSIFSEIWTLDFKGMLDCMEKRFGGKWYLCIRVHPQLAGTMDNYENEELKNRIINESMADDMYEILAGVDALITDYSSVAMDASFGGIPVFIYADDIDDYIADRGSLLWDIQVNHLQCIRNNKQMTPNIDVILPYSVAQNNEELQQQILCFNETEYQCRLNEFEKEVGLVCDGHASARVADYIESCI